jgi:hypothetical protein
MYAMPPRQTRCMFYSADSSGLILTADVERWLTGQNKPTRHAAITLRG